MLNCNEYRRSPLMTELSHYKPTAVTRVFIFRVVPGTISVTLRLLGDLLGAALDNGGALTALTRGLSERDKV